MARPAIVPPRPSIASVPEAEGSVPILTTLAIVLLVLWLLGLVTGTLLGGFIYVLLVAAVVLFLVRLITGRRPV